MRTPLALVCTLAFATACTQQGSTDPDDNGGATAEYGVLFDSSVVHRLDITMDASDYSEMAADLSALYSGGGGGPGGGDATEDPMYVPVELSLDGETLSHAGMRYKGNSTLRGLTQEGNRKLPFRLNMDRFADDFPETDGQELLGFEELTFSPNYKDDSQLREAFAAELFASFGLPAARWSFTEVYVDTGSGPEYWGLYTMLEDPSDNPFRQRVFGDDDGNMYKPESDWTGFVQSEFEKKTNESAADWSDVESSVSALHASQADAAAWRAGLEASFDVDGFLTWLAVNSVMQNWDAYGQMAHNYYLYGDPLDEGRIVWIPWDHNEAMSSRPGPGGDSAGTASEQIFHTSVGSNWPLIQRLLADEVYAQVYEEQVVNATTGAFAEDVAPARLQEMHELIAASIQAEEAGSTTTSLNGFDQSVSDLTAHIGSRHDLVDQALSGQ
ncbi:MAG: CotH kinase family protein [Proteobacteria bacterium]|nr:CotH kinase family protein [Pseudomonadota bacterium]